MHVHEDYQNYPYQLPSLTSDQQQKIEERFVLMTRKGVYPYECMDFFELFQEPQLLPCTSLTEEYISGTDYTHSQRVFNHFNMTGLRDYHNFYLLTNMLLLADVFENFRNACLQYYGLDLAHNYTSLVCPGKLSWKWQVWNLPFSLILTNTCSSRKGAGEEPTDINQYLFIEEEIRGGGAMINHRYA